MAKFEQIKGESRYKNPVIEKLFHEISSELPSFKREINPGDLLSPFFIQPNKTNARIVKQDALLISWIRSNCKNVLLLGDAIDKAIDDCIKEGVLKDILEAHRMEAKEMLFTEYNEEAHINHVKESSFENGMDIMGELFIKLEDQNRLGDYSKAAKDPQFRNQLLKELFPDRGGFA